jgi:hypothetical protein
VPGIFKNVSCPYHNGVEIVVSEGMNIVNWWGNKNRC